MTWAAGPKQMKHWALLVAALVPFACGKTDSTGAGQSDLVCAPPALDCNGHCVDIANDAENCGACAAPCPAGDACLDGICQSTSCPAGRTDCGGLCVDLTTNPLNCGACNTACTQVEACVNSSCACPEPARVCAGVCTDITTSAAHCGGCENACAPDEACSAGSCQPRCPPPLAFCGDRCVDLTSDTTACGNCQTACGPAELCAAGQCECPADADHALCGGVCTDLRVEAAHCGGCGNMCSAGLRCENGLCTSCLNGFFFCPSDTGDPLEICLAQARDAAPGADGGSAQSPDLECQCRNCLVELQDCVSDAQCVSTWQCAVRNVCTTPCWGQFGICSLGGQDGCLKWCPPSTGAEQTAARVEALLRCTHDKGCGM